MARNKHPEVTVNRILEAALQLFWEKGYDNTTIQDIINALGDLSKGAIYHHFKSKEDIFLAIDKRYDEMAAIQFQEVAARKDLTGLEKLRLLIQTNLSPSPEQPSTNSFLAASPSLLDNPRFLSTLIHDTVEVVAPRFIEPLLREGMQDGSIHTEYPREAAEVLAVLSNVWVNPPLWHLGAPAVHEKIAYFSKLLELMGIPLFDEKTIASMDWMTNL